MRELALDSLHADGEHLVLVDKDGQRYRLVIDEALRCAVRSDRPYLEAIRAGARSALPPREIQARLRAGESVESIAAVAGLPPSAIERYESPVVAERAWIVQQTQRLAIGHEVGAPTLGDLVIDRLAARGETAPVTWDARRTAGAPWEVSVTYGADGEEVATWQVDLQARSLTALDSRSRLLSETDLTERRTRTPFDLEAEDARRGADLLIRDSRENAPAATTALPADDGAAPANPESATTQAAATDSLLERLGRARGRRGGSPAEPRPDAHRDAPDGSAEGTEQTEEEAQDGLFQVAPVLRLRRDHEAPPEPPSADADGGQADGAAELDHAVPDAPAKARPRSRRASVPTWDEIVFGSRGE